MQTDTSTETLTTHASDLTSSAYAAIWRAYNHATATGYDTRTARLLGIALVNMERTTDALADAIATEHDSREQAQ